VKWAAPVFLFLAALIVLLTTEPSDLARLLTASVIGFAAEAIGVRYGFVFGAYSYTGKSEARITESPQAILQDGLQSAF
jgi:uncharacterized membrane protein